jgi:nucleoprotein TPR
VFYSRFTASNSELTKKVTEAEIQASLTISDAVPLHREKMRLQSELDSISAHTTWLEQELAARQQDYQHLRQETGDRAIQLQLQLDQTSNELAAAEAKLSVQHKLERDLQQRLSVSTRDNLDLKLQLQQTEEVSAQELEQERRVIDLQKDHIARWQKRYDDIVRENENLKRTAEKALTAGDEEIEAAKERLETKYIAIIKEQATTYEAKLNQLTQQYDEANAPRLMLTTGTSDATTTPRRQHENIEDGPLNMTDLYEKWEECKAELRVETLNRKRWQTQFQRVQQDIAAKAPEMIRQRQEYELAVSQLQDYQSRLASIIQERDDAIADRREATKELQVVEHHLREREAEVQDLAKQVQALLTSRSGGMVTGNDIPTTVVEVQSQNQRLLVEHRRLTQHVADLEERLKTDNFKAALEATEREMNALRRERTEQERLVARIVQQRDLYRALLCKHDSAILDESSSSEEVTALDMAKQQSERIKKYEQDNMEMEANLKSMRSERDRAVRDKEAIEERLARFKAVNDELTSTVNQLQRDLLSTRGAAARSESEATFHQEKCGRLEEAIDRARTEAIQVSNSRSELQKINADLQSSVSLKNAEFTRLESERRQADAKVRMIETQWSTARASEARLADDNRQLRAEIASQGALIESIRRIEASLSSKAEGEKGALQCEVESLLQKLATAENKYMTQNENSTGRIAELEAIVQDLRSSSHQNQSKALEATTEMLECKSELQALKSLYKNVEAQLLAAKRKLGEGDEDGEDVEVKLQSKIDTLEADLESARSEIASLQELADSYQKVAKTNESEVAEIRVVADTYKALAEKELLELKRLVASGQKENLSRQEIIRDLTNDLVGQRGEREKLEQKLQAEISVLKTEIKNNEKDVESAKALAAVLQNDVMATRNVATSAQKSYERELGLHAEARTALRMAHESADEAGRLQGVAENKLQVMQVEFDKLRDVWEQEKSILLDASKGFEKRLQEARDHNKILHSQLETLNSLVEKTQSSRIAAAEVEGEASDSSADIASQKIITELREVIRFLRSENEMTQIQLDTATRSAEREKASAAVFRRSLEDARSKLQEQANDTATAEISTASAENADKLRMNEEQVVLLRDSNKLLREEIFTLKKALNSTEGELVTVKKGAEPAEAVQRELSMKIASLEAEKTSLESELESWKGRMTSLVSNFNQVDPEEHRLLQKKLEEMKGVIESDKNLKATTEESLNRVRLVARNQDKQRRELQQKIEVQRLEIEQLSSEKAALSSVAKAESSSQKEVEQLEQRISKMESDAKSAKTELDGMNSQNDGLRRKLREYKTLVNNLQSQVKSLTEQLTDAQASVAPAMPSEPVHRPNSFPPKGSVEPMSRPVATPAMNDAMDVPLIDDIRIPAVPPDGFSFGPSNRISLTDDMKNVLVPTAVTTLRPDATSFLPQSTVSSNQQASTVTELPMEGAGTTVAPAPALESQLTSSAVTSKLVSISETEKASTGTSQSLPKDTLSVAEIPDSKAETKAVETTAAAPDSVAIASDSMSNSKESVPRRLSSEKKEMDMKMKILEKKRRLETLKALTMKQQESQSDKLSEDSNDEPHAFKKAKTEAATNSSDEQSTSVVVVVSAALENIDSEVVHVPLPPGNDPASYKSGNNTAGTKPEQDVTTATENVVVVSAVTESSKVDMLTTDEEEKYSLELPVVPLEQEEPSDIVVDTTSHVILEVEAKSSETMEESTDTRDKPEIIVADVPLIPPFRSPFGSVVTKSTTFGSSATTTTFGQSLNIWATPSTSTLVAPNSSSSSSNNEAAASLDTRSFHTTSTTTTTTAVPLFGGASTSHGGPFLNMKPPTSSMLDVPKFTFGNSGSNITLPSPTVPTTHVAGTAVSQQPLFGVFSTAASHFGGSGGRMMMGGSGISLPTKPLFDDVEAVPIMAAAVAAVNDEVLMEDDDDDDDDGAMDAQEE